MNTNITITYSQFILDFPEFNSPLQANPAFPQFVEGQFNYYFNLAQLLIDPQNRVNDFVNQLAELFIAHHLVLEALSLNEMNFGGVPGVAKGAIAGKSAGDVAISYAPQATLELDGGHWNYTIYGQRFLRLARIAGAGPVQVGPPGCGPNYNGSGWPGVVYWDVF